jgi:hypothetical protein
MSNSSSTVKTMVKRTHGEIERLTAHLATPSE